MIRPAVTGIAIFLASVTANAAEYPAPKEGDWIAKDFKFHPGG
jgi:homoserine O-acetyltransferase